MAFAPIPDATKARVRELAAETHPRTKKPLWSQAAIGAEVGISKASVCGILKTEPVGGAAPAPVAGPARMPDPAPRLPAPDPMAGGPSMPEPHHEVYEDYRVDAGGAWLVISDIHLPFHDKRAVESAVREAERRNVTGVILNGDILDFYQISRFSRDPSKPRIKDEIQKGRQLLEWLRSRFPRARLLFKEGNHDERLKTYLSERAPELFDLDDLHLPNLLRASDYGVEWVGDRRVIQLGKLPVIHGHEYPGSGGVMPARWLFIRAWSSALCGHFHQPSHFPATSLDNREMGVWSTGCACFLAPYYRRKNAWRHGYAMVDIGSGGVFEVANREVLKDGRVV
jgi:predicted phosphodiesterase